MSIAQAILREFEGQVPVTRKFLERLPENDRRAGRDRIAVVALSFASPKDQEQGKTAH